jgi:hypothetical protein
MPYEPGTPDVTAEVIFDIVSSGKLLRSIGKIATPKIASRYIARQAEKRAIFSSEQKLAKVYMRHGKDLGMMGNYSRANAERLVGVIINHVKNPYTVMIKGTYRGTEKAIHYFNPHSGILVITKPNGELWSAWKISRDQIMSLYKTGNIQ